MKRVLAVVLAGLIVPALVACGDDGDDGDDGDSAGEPVVVGGAGDITHNLEEYRALLGDDNGGGPETYESGRREINWDAVPDEFSRPNGYPSDFFNAAEEPRARGIVLETDGEGLGVSADSDNPDGAPVRFGDVNPSYSDTFTTFSEERLFSPIGSNVVDLHFFVPGTDTPAVTRGFGAVYTDVDTEDSAEFELFDADDQSLGRFSVPVSQDGLSFLGIAFDDPVVARVRIVYGDSALGPDDDEQHDVAVMDDFIFGEPQAIGS